MRLQKYSLKQLEELQKQLSSKVILKDVFDLNMIKFVGGADVAYKNDRGCAAVVVLTYPELELAEKIVFTGRVSFPYIPGFLSFREGPLIEKAYNKLKIRPDVLLVNGNGIMHFRFFGLASHVGVMLDIPTIGITQNLLCGSVKDDYVYYKNRLVGYKYLSKEGCKDIYISPGHMISFKTAISITKTSLRQHKLPEPLYFADKLSKECFK